VDVLYVGALSMNNRERRVTGAEIRGKVMRAYDHNKLTKEERYRLKREKALERARKRKLQPKSRRMTVDKDGNPVKLNPYQKREMYRRAQILKSRIKKAMLSRDQHWKPTEHDVELLRKREHGVAHLKRE